jgi:hypothetical protein
VEHDPHALAKDGPMDMLLALAESGDDGDHSGEVGVMLRSTEERRSSCEKIDPHP